MQRIQYIVDRRRLLEHMHVRRILSEERQQRQALAMVQARVLDGADGAECGREVALHSRATDFCDARVLRVSCVCCGGSEAAAATARALWNLKNR